MRWLLVAAPLWVAGCDKLFGLEAIDRGDGAIVGPCEFRDVSIGRRHTCAVDGAGAVWCWGLNESWQVEPAGAPYVLAPTKVVLASPAKQVAAGRDFTCALLETGAVYCWGSTSNGQLGTGASTGLSGVVPVALGTDRVAEIGAGAYHACARLEADGTVKCWGANTYQESGMTTNPSLLPVAIANTAGSKRLDVGHRHNCIVDANDQAACWGRGNSYQLGSSTTTNAIMPRTVANLGPVTHVAAAGKASCAVEQNGDVRCWGRGAEGQLGLGNFDPVMMPGGATTAGAVQVELGSHGGCARTVDGFIDCWGTLDIGDGTLDFAHTPRRSSVTGATLLEANFYATCAIANNEIVCWGENTHGVLGRGSRGVSATPVPVAFAAPRQLVVSESGACGLATDGSVRCWGDNDFGELGTGNLTSSYTPVDVAIGFTATGIAAGWNRVCAWSATQAKCWGQNTYGMTGNGMSSRDQPTPTLVLGFTMYTSIGMGQSHTCALSNGSVRCWGYNGNGQLGNGTNTTSMTPVQANGMTSVAKLVVGRDHTCVRTTSGAVYCWGINSRGQLGTNNHATSTLPVMPTPPSPANAVLDIGVGSEHTCALTTANEVYCWGSNQYGQLGLGPAIAERIVPSKVELADLASAIFVGGRTTCARLMAGEMYCWGDGAEGQRGDGLTDVQFRPVPVGAHAGASSFSIGRDGGCSITNGNAACWGQTKVLGNNDVSHATPMPVSLSCR